MTAAAPATGHETAIQELIEAHLPLVGHVVAGVAARFPRHADREELTGAGSLGLVEAARRYDPALGVPFARYASTRIRGAVLDAARAVDFAPRAVRAREREQAAVADALAARLGREPTRVELAERLGCSLADLDQHEDRSQRSAVLSLDAGTDGQDTGASLAESIIDSAAPDPLRRVEQRERSGYLRDALALLPERLRAVVEGYFLEGRTSVELAAELGVTESRVSQLRSEAVAMLRAGIAAQYDRAQPQPQPQPRSRTAGGLTAQRHAAFASQLSAASSLRSRLAPATPAHQPA